MLLENNYNAYISIIINTSQFYKEGDDMYDDIDNINIGDSLELREFKKQCKRAFGKDALKEYGGGVIELIITEKEFNKFAIIAEELNVEYEIDDVIEF